MTPPLKKMYTPSFSLILFLTFLAWPCFSHSAVRYTYDEWNQLIQANYSDGTKLRFDYDGVGNRLSQTVTKPAEGNIYENGEDGQTLGWDVYDNTPSGAQINNVYDDIRKSRVIAFNGDGTANGYRLRNEDHSNWDVSEFKVLEWSMRYSESFVVYIAVQTTQGFRYIYYTQSANDNLGDSTYIHHGLQGATDGNWHTFIRDLEYDLKEAQPDNELEAVLGFLIRGSGRVDDIQTLAALPADLDSDSDGLSDLEEIDTYGTHPYHADSDGDGINDEEELSYWGSSWNTDADSDGIINILDADSDNDGFSDGLERSGGTDPTDPGSLPVNIVYEDAEDGLLSGWDVYDNTPTGAIIDNVYDDSRASRVIEFNGDGTANGYRLRNEDHSNWDDSEFKVLEWSMRYSESFVVYIAVQTTQGFRYIYYTQSANDNLGDSTYIHHGLQGVTDGNWHTIIRDLEYDLKEAQPDNELEAVLGFFIRGSGWVDDIQTLAELPADLDSDSDGLSDLEEIDTYGTHPYHTDSDGDGINDGQELDYWESDWNGDADGDGIVNILDADSDNDGFTDGVEITQGTNPADSHSLPVSIIYENAEDGLLSGWDIYDNTPEGATIENVYDDLRASRVIEFSGSGTSNGYRLRNDNFTYWYDETFKVIEWSMRYDESFVVYIAAQTSQGFRYIYYTSAETDSLGTETYIHHGLGSAIRDGNWHTITRDLEYDLKEAQPENELESILGFYIRGSGRVDDIITK